MSDGAEARASDGRRTGLLVAHAVSWMLVCLFAVAPVSMLVAAAAEALGRPALATTMWFAAAVEAVVHGALAGAAFWIARGPAVPRRWWLTAPAGYLAAFAAYVAIMLVLGDTMALPRGWDWAYVAADTVAVTAGAWLAMRATPPAGPDQGVAEGPPA